MSEMTQPDAPARCWSLLALDPGETTGWSRWAFSDRTPLTLLEYGQITHGLRGFIRHWKDNDWDDHDVVIAESFRLDGRTPYPNVTPLKIEGALAVLWHSDVEYQSNLAKNLCRDSTLKRLNYWFVGQEHARDSARHAIAWAKRKRHPPTLAAKFGMAELLDNH